LQLKFHVGVVTTLINVATKKKKKNTRLHGSTQRKQYLFFLWQFWQGRIFKHLYHWLTGPVETNL